MDLLKETTTHLLIMMEAIQDLEDKLIMVVVKETVEKVIVIHSLDKNYDWMDLFLTIQVKEHLTSSFKQCKK